MNVRSVAGSILAWAMLAGLWGPARAQDARIESLVVAPAGQGLEVSYDLAGALNAQVLERLQAGIPITYRHRVQWLSRRGFLLLPDREQSEVVVAVTATYDSLTRTYALLRVTTARSRGSGPAAPAAEERSSTDSLEVVRAWMTRMEDLRVPPPARPPGDERQMLRITASFGRRMVLGMFPARRSVSVEHPLGP